MYQIEIFEQDRTVDMQAVCRAIADLMTDDQIDARGVDIRERNKVYVRFGTVGEAVRRINALGYATDEDDAGEDE